MISRFFPTRYERPMSWIVANRLGHLDHVVVRVFFSLGRYTTNTETVALYCSGVSAPLSSMVTRLRRLLFSCCNSVILVFNPVRTLSTILFTVLGSWIRIASVTGLIFGMSSQPIQQLWRWLECHIHQDVCVQ